MEEKRIETVLEVKPVGGANGKAIAAEVEVDMGVAEPREEEREAILRGAEIEIT